MDRTFLFIGALLGGVGVGLGAFGAHGLKGRLSPDMLAVFETGVRYQGAITPIGGVAFLAGWLALAIAAF